MYSQMCKHYNFDLLVSVEVTYLCRLCQWNCVSHRPAVCLHHRRYRVVSRGTCCVSCPGVWYAVSSVCRTQSVGRAVYLVQVSEMLSRLSTGHSLCDVLCILSRCLRCCLVCLPDTVCVTCCVSCPCVWDAVSSVYRTQFVWRAVYLVQVSEMLSRLSIGHSLWNVLCILSRCLRCCLVCLSDTVCGTCCVSCPGVWDAVSSVYWTQSLRRAVYLVQVSEMLSRLSTEHSLCDVLCILFRCLKCCLVCLLDTVCVTCCVSCPGVWDAVSSVYRIQFVWRAVYLVQVSEMLSRLSTGHSLCDVLCILSRCLICCLVCLLDTVCVTCCVSCPGVWDAVSSVYRTQFVWRAVYLVQVSEMLSRLSTGHSLWDVLCTQPRFTNLFVSTDATTGAILRKAQTSLCTLEPSEVYADLGDIINVQDIIQQVKSVFSCLHWATRRVSRYSIMFITLDACILTHDVYGMIKENCQNSVQFQNGIYNSCM